MSATTTGGLSTSHGNRWRLLAAGGIGAAAVAALAFGARGTGFTTRRAAPHAET